MRPYAVIALLVTFFSLPLPTFAQSFSLTPGKIEVELSPGSTITREIAITNTLGGDATFKVEFEDVEASSIAEGGIKLLGTRIGKQSLKNYFLTPEQFVAVPAGATVRVPITITLPLTAFPGSLHGGIFVSPVPTRNVTTGPQAVPRLGLLVFVRVPGDRVEVGKLDKFFIWPKLVVGEGVGKATIIFSNTGNTYLNPYGLVTISSLSGREVATAPLKPWFVLPQSTREYQIQLPTLPIGIYKIKLELNRGYANQIDNDRSWLVIMPWWLIGIFSMIAIVLIGFVIWRVFKVRMIY